MGALRTYLMLNPKLILVAIIWGVNFAFVKFALKDEWVKVLDTL